MYVHILMYVLFRLLTLCSTYVDKVSLRLTELSKGDVFTFYFKGQNMLGLE